MKAELLAGVVAAGLVITGTVVFKPFQSIARDVTASKSESIDPSILLHLQRNFDRAAQNAAQQKGAEGCEIATGNIRNFISTFSLPRATNMQYSLAQAVKGDFSKLTACQSQGAIGEPLLPIKTASQNLQPGQRGFGD